MAKCLIYARVSSDEQREENLSIPTQLYEDKKWIEANEHTLVGDRYVSLITGFEVPKGTPDSIPAYVDDYTGFSVNRPVLDQVYEDISSLNVDTVVVYRADRLGRGEYRVQVKKLIKQRGAKVQNVRGNNYSDDATGELHEKFDDAISHYNIRRWIEDAQGSKRTKARLGQAPNGRKAYGYISDPGSDSGLAIFEPEATIVRQIFSEYVAGKSLGEIANQLNADKVDPPEHKHNQRVTHWYTSSLNKMLRREIYCGTSYYGMSRRSKLHGDKANVPIDRYDPVNPWIPYETPAIVSREVWQRVQDKLDDNRQYKRHVPKRNYLLRGMLVCADCGKAYTGNTVKAKPEIGRASDHLRYSHRIKLRHCCNRSIKAQTIETRVWNEVCRLFLEPDYLQQAYERALQKADRNYQLQIDLLASCENELVERIRDKDKLLTLLLREKISESTYTQRVSRLDQEIAQYEQMRLDAENILKDRPTQDMVDELSTLAKKLKTYLEMSDPPFAIKRQVLEVLNLKVRIDQSGSHKLDGWFVANGSESVDTVRLTSLSKSKQGQQTHSVSFSLPFEFALLERKKKGK